MSIILIFIIVATGLVSFKGFNDVVFFEKYKFQVSKIQQGEVFRMFTSGFLHADLGHLFFNMFTLYIFAPVVANYLGNVSFLIIYVSSLLAGSLLTMQLHKKQPWYSAIGASGAVTGIVYAAILIYPDMSLYLFFIPIPIPAYVFGIGYLLYSLYGMKKLNDGIGHTAHFGGAIGGLVTTVIFDYTLLINHSIIAILLIIPIILLYAFKNNFNR